jgi:predicted PurR-regulated permease PerM
MEPKYIGKRLTYLIIPIFGIIYTLILARDFLYPLAFGILLSYLLYPIVNFLEKKGFPRILSILVTILAAVAVFVVITIFVLKRVNLFMDELPKFRQMTVNHIESLQKSLETNFGIPAERIKKFLINNIFDLGNRSEKIFAATTGTIFAIFMQPVYVFLFLYYRTKFAYFYLKVVGRNNRPIAVLALREIANVVTRYMLGVTTVVLILCFFNSAGLLLIGVKYPLLLGVIMALFSFIPYFGNIIGGVVVLTFVLLTGDSTVYAFRVVIFTFIVHFTENNILSPNIVGNNIRMNPFIIILGLISGAMIWGIPGMLVTIPFLAMLKIVLKKIPSMQAFAYLMGTRGTKKHEFNLKSIRDFYIRIKNRRSSGKENRKKVNQKKQVN